MRASPWRLVMMVCELVVDTGRLLCEVHRIGDPGVGQEDIQEMSSA